MTAKQVLRHFTVIACMAAFGVPAAPTDAAAQARSVIAPMKDEVRVNVNYTTELPLAGISEAALAEAQKHGREVIYRLVRGECAILMANLAKTCALRSLNVSARIREWRNGRQPTLSVHGNAYFSITVKPF